MASHGGNVTGPPEVVNGGPIETDDGLTLETLWDRPAIPPVGAVVLCHPHPLQGGTMTVPLIRAMSASLIDRGAVVLRFNFRGVGDSEGTWGGGLAEIYDVAAAVAAIGEVYAGVPLGSRDVSMVVGQLRCHRRVRPCGFPRRRQAVSCNRPHSLPGCQS